MITAIDPGTDKSAVIVFDGKRVHTANILGNDFLIQMARDSETTLAANQIAIEMVASYGMPVGREVFETVRFIGRLQEALERKGGTTRLVYRKDVKIHLCGSMRAKDGNIRQALIDKYGAPGTKKNPGPTYGVSSHLWSALAIADYALANPLT